MAALKLTCKECNHTYYQIVVECNRDGVDMTCPNCSKENADVHVVRTKDGSTPFAKCKH